MIITKLALNNFGVYEGDNSFSFGNQKPIVLIGGLNGRGKTTILEAILIALYGKSSFAYSESIYSSYGKYLNAFVNETSGNEEASIELTFEDSGSEYIIKKSWSSAGSRTRERCVVFKDGIESKYLADNWAIFMETILPSGLSNYFFFDGEKIAEIAGDKTDAKMKAAIKTLLGINVIERLEKDIGQVSNSVEKNAPSQHALDEMKQLRLKKDEAKNVIEKWETEIEKTVERIEQYEKRVEELNNNYTSKGGDLFIKQRELLTKKKETELELEDVVSKRIALAATELPLAMLEEDLVEILAEGREEHENNVMKKAVERITDLFNEYSANKKQHAIEKGFLEYIQEQFDEVAEPLYELSDSGIYRLEQLLRSDLVSQKTERKTLKFAANQLQGKIDEYDQYLSVDIDEAVLANIYRKIKSTENKMIAAQEELKRYEEELRTANWEYMQANASFKAVVETVLKDLEGGEAADRIISYSAKLIEIFDEYTVRLQKKKIGALSETITDCYRALANKKKMIRRVVVDPETLDINYYDYSGKSINKQALSAGEKQLMVISILWALAIQSKKKLPVIIDTPLSRMDSEHRMALVSTYFPNASDQVLILSTDSEIDDNYYHVMKPQIGNEYTLVYDDDRRSTSIQEGYMLGDEQ